MSGARGPRSRSGGLPVGVPARAGAGRVGSMIRDAAVSVLLVPVHLWRMTVVLRQPRCRFYPSCSTYALGALRSHGPFRGGVLAAGRVLRCHPWSPGGIDHVPPAQSPSQFIRKSPVERFGVHDA